MNGSGPARILVRPLATPLPLGFLALFVATVSFASFQLGWIPPDQVRFVAAAVLLLTVPAQLLASVLGFLCRDPIAGTGMGILAGTWATAGAVTLVSPPGSTSPGLGIVLVAAGASLVIPAAAGREKRLAAVVIGLSALRFVVTGVSEMSGSSPWMVAAGWTGLVLGAVSFYAALAFELEGVRHQTVLPVGRTGEARTAMTADEASQLAGVEHEAGVRRQL